MWDSLAVPSTVRADQFFRTSICRQPRENTNVSLPPKQAKRPYERGMTRGDQMVRQPQPRKPTPSRSCTCYSECYLHDRYKYLFVSARNTDVERALRIRYVSPGPGLSINVFCVGNRDYEGAEYRSQEAHLRAIQGSGIPDLRRFCHSVVAQAQYDASLHFLEVELASLLQSLEVWLSVSEQTTRVSIDPQIVSDLQTVCRRPTKTT